MSNWPYINGQRQKNSLRCSYCETPWPNDLAFEMCPTCQEPTVEHHNQAIDPAVAKDMSNQSRFGWYLINSLLAGA